jgi:hypothetical protein
MRDTKVGDRRITDYSDQHLRRQNRHGVCIAYFRLLISGEWRNLPKWPVEFSKICHGKLWTLPVILQADCFLVLHRKCHAESKESLYVQ